MANGFHGEKAEWDRLEAPLRAMDFLLQAFADEKGIALERNDHNWPSRGFIWGDSVRRRLQIFLHEDYLTWKVWLCASEDRAGGRFSKSAFLRKDVTIDVIAGEISAILEEGFAIVEGWSAADFELAVPPR